jgi:acetylornithine deacetylase
MLVEIETIVAGLSSDVSVETMPLARVLPLDCAAESPAVGIVRGFGGLWPPLAMPFGTEASFFQQAGIPALVCGPGSIAQAHQPNEWIALAELDAADRFLERVGAWAAGTS